MGLNQIIGGQLVGDDGLQFKVTVDTVSILLIGLVVLVAIAGGIGLGRLFAK